MLYSIKLNNQTYEIYPQIKYVDKLTTDLDMFEITLKPIDEELDLDFKKYKGLVPLTLMVNGEDYKKMYLSFYKCVNVQHNPKKYKYLFQCVSETFQLQRITLPNKLITQPITDDKRTVWQELNKIMEVYYPEIFIRSSLKTLMDIPCPEMSFTKSTLHEVLIALFAVCGLVPKIENNYLDCIDLKSSANVTNWNSEDIFIRVEKSNNVQDYADALDYDIENAIDDGDDITTQWLSVTSDEVVVTPDNFLWKTPSEIYEIVKVQAKVKIYYALIPNGASYQDVVVDITNYVVPKEVWETFKTSSSTGFVSGNYKRNYVYYEGNTLNGNFEEGSLLGYESDKSIKNAVYWALKNNPLYTDIDTTYFSPYRDIILKVTYKTQNDGIRVKVVRDEIKIPRNNLISNQDDAFININNFGKQKKEFINRTGNELTVGQARFDLSKIEKINELTIAKIGDRVDDDYIITQREMQFNENSLLVNYQLAKDYVYLTGYSGLNQVKRFTSIDTKNTLVRNDLIMYTLTISQKATTYTDYAIEYAINNYAKVSKDGVNLHYVKTFNKNNEELQDYYILVTSQNKVIADSVVCNFRFESNIKAGDSITKENNTYLKEPIMYADNNGEFTYLELYFGVGEEQRNVEDLAIVRKYPRVDEITDNAESEMFLINKDNREITSISLQFRFVGDDDTIVYSDFAKYTQLTAHSFEQLKIYVKHVTEDEEYKKLKYTKTTLTPIGDLQTTASLSFENNQIKIKNVANDFGYWLVGVTDSNDNLLLGVNYQKLDALSTITLYVDRQY